MEKYYNSDKVWSVKAYEVADELKLAKLLCKRVMEDDYLINALTLVEQKYGELKPKFEQSSKKGYVKMTFDESPEERTVRSKASKHSEYMQKQDIDYLFTYMSKHIKKWWD